MNPRTIKKQIYKNFNEISFINDIKQSKVNGDFAPVHQATNIEDAGEAFNNAFLKTFDLHAPIKVIQNRSNYVPYVTNELKELMAERDRLKLSASKSGDNQDFQNYKTLRNELTTKLKSAKFDYYQQKFKNNCATSS